MESETPPEKQEHSFDLTSNSRRLIVLTQTAAEAYCSAWNLVVRGGQNGSYILGIPITENTDPTD